MTLPEIIERVQRLPSGAIITDENRYDEPYIETLVNTFRGQIIRSIYAKDKRINPQCYQKLWVKIDPLLQDDPKCFVKFAVPQVISIDNISDGFRYIGTIDRSTNYKRVSSRAWLSTFNGHQVMNVSSGRFVSALYDGGAGVMEIYGNIALEELLIEGLFAIPGEVPTYNKEFDPYPLADNDIPLLEDMIFRGQTSIEASSVPDKVSNSNDTNGALAPRRK